jgi:hypothetical protein
VRHRSLLLGVLASLVVPAAVEGVIAMSVVIGSSLAVLGRGLALGEVGTVY